MKTHVIIGLDFVDADGVRRTNFCLCAHRKDGLRTVAMVDTADGRVTRHCYINELEHRTDAVLRLARIYQGRSVPQVFGRRAL